MKRRVNKAKKDFRNRPAVTPALWNQLERFNALGIRTAGFLHQLKTPLHVIQSQAEFLMEDPSLPKTVRGSLAMILQNTERLNVQTREMLRWARGEGFQMRAASLTPLVEEIMHFAGSACRKQGIALQADLQAQAMVLMDPVPLQGAIQNYVNNAIEAMPQGGHLVLQTFDEPESRRVALVIEDTGPGMSRARLSEAQRPFRSTKADGTGLGLFIASHILERHRAQVRWESEVGQGTVISILFPMAANA